MSQLPGRNLEPEIHAEGSADPNLLERICAGDASAFASFLSESWRPLVSYCAKIVGSVDAAEDISQEAFIRFWEHRSDWKPRSSARAILYTIARNLALNERQSLDGRRRLLARSPKLSSGEPTGPDEMVQSRDLESAIDKAISMLPPRQQEIVQLSRLNGLSRSEIAEITGLSSQTVANHLVMALKNLRKILGPLLRES